MTMKNPWTDLLEVNLPTAGEREQLRQLAVHRRWGVSLVLVGWLHLLAFAFCYYLTVGRDYHEPSGYLAVWAAELLATWLIFRLRGGPRWTPPLPLEQAIRRVWIAYFILAFDLGSLNTLRGHQMFEFFPATGTLASFAFLMMTVLVDGRFFAAVLVMFASGLLMAAYLLHAYLIFALAWWLVLNGIGLVLCCGRRQQPPAGKGAEGDRLQLAVANDPD
jgi:hypothetical protein